MNTMIALGGLLEILGLAAIFREWRIGLKSARETNRMISELFGHLSHLVREEGETPVEGLEWILPKGGESAEAHEWKALGAASDEHGYELAREIWMALGFCTLIGGIVLLTLGSLS